MGLSYIYLPNLKKYNSFLFIFLGSYEQNLREAKIRLTLMALNESGDLIFQTGVPCYYFMPNFMAYQHHGTHIRW